MTSRDFDAIERWFSSFSTAYLDRCGDRRPYELKVEHTRRVVGIMDRLTVMEGIPEEERLILRTVALCHDVGRFPQYESYGTFNDLVSRNHATLAVQTLRRHRVLSRLSPEEESLVLQGVALHNRFHLPPCLPPRTLMVARFIRDADKLDIWRVMIAHFTSPPAERMEAVVWELPDTGRCSPEVVRQIVAGRVVDRTLLKSADDFKLLQLSWVYDLSYRGSLALLGEFGYVDRLEEILSHDPAAKPAVDAVKHHLRMKGGFR